MRKLVVTIAAVLALSACGHPASTTTTSSSTPSSTATAAAAPSTTAEVDPYEVYLANNPDPSLVLSREDAQTRAYLGCGTTWAPGTIDRALADAYAATVCP